MITAPVSLLIVDDDPVFAQFVRQLLLSLADQMLFETRCVDTAEKAFEELKRADYELVLLDYHLPKADGLEVLAEIRREPEVRQPAVIMLTGSGNESVAVEAMKLGARDYLPKADLDVAPLLRALRNALTQKRLAAQVATYNEQRQADLELARRLQLSMLPDKYPSFPAAASREDSALRFSHRFCPAAELAGDFFSVLPLSDTRAGVFICDVMGHGVRSALVTAMMRALVDSEGARANDPGAFLTAMNRRLRTLIRPTDGPMFATAFYLILDVANGTMRYATGGHPRPLHLQRQSGRVAPLVVPAGAGPALGLFADAAYVNCESPVGADDVVLLFTDGLFEVTSAAGEQDFGKDRLLEVTRHCLGLPPEQLCDAILAEVRDFAGEKEFEDDLCLLSVEVARLRDART